MICLEKLMFYSGLDFITLVSAARRSLAIHWPTPMQRSFVHRRTLGRRFGCNGYEGDVLPIDINRLEARTFVGEVVMKTETTAFLAAAQKLGCRTQIGTEMLFEQIPAYLI
jgi:hypothetical protein